MSEPRGKMPGVLAGVTKIMVARYVAPCGHRFTSRSAAKSHEAAATCWKLPALKTCQSCKHSKVMSYKEDGQRYWERDCKRRDIDVDSLPPVHENAPDVLTECPGWEHAGQRIAR